MSDQTAVYRHLIYQALQPLVPVSAPVALFGFPEHPNIGDSAIYAGELSYIDQKLGGQIIFAGGDNLVNGVLPKLPLDAVILIHGGGNLGDIWPKYQGLREAIIATYRSNRIIQFPQSIRFLNQENENRFARICRRHEQFFLLTRDQRSLERAKLWHSQDLIRLCPDMALMLELDRPESAIAAQFVALLRTDRECMDDVSRLAMDRRDTRVCDWATETPSVGERVLWRILRAGQKLSKTPYTSLI
jgi:exopolysaccharide biosynthesis predicted pyruvyltransferase EpsI